MATWNTSKPGTSNQILEDVPDIQENLDELHDIIVAITDGTPGTTEPAAFTVDTLAANSVDSADIVAGAIDLAHMSVNSVDSDQYVDGSIDTAHFASGAVDVTAMGVNSVDSDQYVDGSIDTAHFAAGAVDVTAMGADSVDSSELVDGAVDNSHMAVNSIDSDQYVDGSIDTAHFAAGAVDQAAVGAAAVGQGELKTTTGSVTSTSVTIAVFTLPGGEYGFYPQLKVVGSRYAQATIGYTIGTDSTSYLTVIELKVSVAGDGAYVQQRYVQASGEVHWVFIKRNKATKEVTAIWQAPDHPCLGNGGDPTEIDQPYLNYDKATEEVIAIHPTKEQVKEIRVAAKAERLDFLQVFKRDYELDESKQSKWPTKEVTVDLDECLDTGARTVIKKKISKPKNVKCYAISKK